MDVHGAVGVEAGQKMTDDIDIYRSHNEPIKQYGDDAPIHAAMRADEMMENGNLGGLDVWKRIIAAIKKLQAKERPNRAEVH